MNQQTAIRISVTLFVASLFFPVFQCENTESAFGLEVLMGGWWGVLLMNVGWFANVAWAISIFQKMKGRSKPAFFWSLCAAVLSLEGFAVTEWWFNEGVGTPVKSLGPGFYLWFAAIVFLFIVNGLTIRRPSPSLETDLLR